MRPPNFLSGGSLDRAAELRRDDQRLREVWESNDSRVTLLWRSKHLLRSGEPPEPAWLNARDVASCLPQEESRVMLGRSEQATVFALDVSHLDDPLRTLGLTAGHSLEGLRDVGALMSQEQAALLAYANGMMSWHRRHRYCGCCGSPTEVSQAGHVRACSAESCGTLHFPRLDPAVIVLVWEEDRCLLGRQSSWPKQVYSCLAGFVEQGESLEEATKREVKEETGIEIEDLRYHSSQPWPFPSSLMLGFTGRAVTREIHLHDKELEDARWFTRRELEKSREIKLPSPVSIARRLVEDWLAGR